MNWLDQEEEVAKKRERERECALESERLLAGKLISNK